MAALGLTTYAQFALATNIYTKLVEFPSRAPVGAPQRIVHQVPSSTVHPQKEYGRGPVVIEGLIQIVASSKRTFISDLQTQTKRKASWVDDDGTEVYMYVYAGEVTSERAMVPYGSPAGTKLVRIGFRFNTGDQRLYKAADDSVLLGA